MRTFAVLATYLANFHAVTLVIAYYVTIVLCIVLNAELVDNPNRAGFLAIAQLPPVFLLATKNSPLAILISSGYEKLNYLHRWCSRGTVFAAAVHGALWIRNHREYGLQILGSQKETSGVAALALLFVLAISSVRPVRTHVYQIFRVIQYVQLYTVELVDINSSFSLLAVPAFVITLCYHTLYAAPYVYPPLAFYGFDLFLRLLRFRVKDATLVAPDAHLTIVRVHDCMSGWSAGQHVRLRIFIANHMFESHPLTIMNAPRATTCLGDIGMDQELILGARVKGDWTHALNAYARNNSVIDSDTNVDAAEPSAVAVSSEIVVERGEDEEPINLADLPAPSKTGNVEEKLVSETLGWSPAFGGAAVRVMLDGPYGGCAIDLGACECVLLVSGGSGVTFALGLLDDLVGRCVKLGRRNGEVTTRVEFAWCIRSFGALRWVTPLLNVIALRAAAPESTLDLHISVYVTCLCRPEDIPPIPNCDVLVERPTVQRLLDNFVSQTGTARDEESSKPKGSADWSSVAICAGGPENLTAEAKNAAARLALRNPTRRVECHTEAYFL